jgi:hypothetical protein
MTIAVLPPPYRIESPSLRRAAVSRKWARRGSKDKIRKEKVNCIVLNQAMRLSFMGTHRPTGLASVGSMLNLGGHVTY